jgi:hypothetical protein
LQRMEAGEHRAESERRDDRDRDDGREPGKRA